jgi:hypothetical protein
MLPRRWITIQVPGTDPSPRLRSTYVAYDGGAVPRVPEGVGDWSWLRRAPVREGSMASRCELAECDLSSEALWRLLPNGPPADLLAFVLEPDLRARLWSATDAYFDLGHHVVDADGGHLLHLVSDSQWVMHWSLYLGRDGRTAMVAGPGPTGFDLDEEDQAARRDGYTICADSFPEFLWRWWMDNEVFRRLVMEKVPLTDAQQRYVRQYGQARLLD